MTPSIALTPEIERLARQGASFAFSVSGGKDGNIAAVEVNAWLDSIGHDRRRRLAVHADLGIIEWADSLVMCREVAEHMGVPLKVVRHNTHDMISRWQQRFANSLERYVNMETIQLVSPWSTPSKRFCTSEMKQQVIEPELARWTDKNSVIISVVGIRGEESPNRAKQPVWQRATGMDRISRGVKGYLWRAIHPWTLAEVKAAHVERGVRLHEAYTKYNSTRVSCAYCIMSSEPDLHASANNPQNAESYGRVSELEISSGFSFQGDRWLASIRPDLLPPGAANGLAVARAKRIERDRVEGLIPEGMLYVSGWPTFVPDLEQCELLAGVRRRVCEMYGLRSPYLTAETIQARYRQLIAEKRAQDAKKAEKAARPKRAARVRATPALALVG